MKHKLLIAFTFALSLFLTGCPESMSEPGKSIFETARMEDLSENSEEARKLYQQIVDKYPDTRYAELAKERLTAMDKQE